MITARFIIVGFFGLVTLGVLGVPSTAEACLAGGNSQTIINALAPCTVVAVCTGVASGERIRRVLELLLHAGQCAAPVPNPHGVTLENLRVDGNKADNPAC